MKTRFTHWLGCQAFLVAFAVITGESTFDFFSFKSLGIVRRTASWAFSFPVWASSLAPREASKDLNFLSISASTIASSLELATESFAPLSGTEGVATAAAGGVTTVSTVEGVGGEIEGSGLYEVAVVSNPLNPTPGKEEEDTYDGPEVVLAASSVVKDEEVVVVEPRPLSPSVVVPRGEKVEGEGLAEKPMLGKEVDMTGASKEDEPRPKAVPNVEVDVLECIKA